MTAGKLGLVTAITGLGILDGEGHNWDCINASFAKSTFDQLIQPKSTEFVGDVKDWLKWAQSRG